MNVGFTGTRQGMTDDQFYAFLKVLDDLTSQNPEIAFHHGDCLGADATAAEIAWIYSYRIIAHPPLDSKHRAFTDFNDEYRRRLPFLDRNHAIVDESEVLIATPAEYPEILRSGTWATVRYAKKKLKRVIVIRPDGIVEI